MNFLLNSISINRFIMLFAGPVSGNESDEHCPDSLNNRMCFQSSINLRVSWDVNTSFASTEEPEKQVNNDDGVDTNQGTTTHKTARKARKRRKAEGLPTDSSWLDN